MVSDGPSTHKYRLPQSRVEGYSKGKVLSSWLAIAVLTGNGNGVSNIPKFLDLRLIIDLLNGVLVLLRKSTP